MPFRPVDGRPDRGRKSGLVSSSNLVPTLVIESEVDKLAVSFLAREASEDGVAGANLTAKPSTAGDTWPLAHPSSVAQLPILCLLAALNDSTKF